MCVDPLPLPSAFRRSCRAMGVIVRRRIDRIAAVDEPSGCPRDSNAPRAAGRFAAKPRSRSEPAATDCADRVGGPPCRSPDRITRVRPTRGLGPASVDETAPRAVASSARRGRNRVVGSPGALRALPEDPVDALPVRPLGGRPTRTALPQGGGATHLPGRRCRPDTLAGIERRPSGQGSAERSTRGARSGSGPLARVLLGRDRPCREPWAVSTNPLAHAAARHS